MHRRRALRGIHRAQSINRAIQNTQTHFFRIIARFGEKEFTTQGLKVSKGCGRIFFPVSMDHKSRTRKLENLLRSDDASSLAIAVTAFSDRSVQTLDCLIREKCENQWKSKGEQSKVHLRKFSN